MNLTVPVLQTVVPRAPAPWLQECVDQLPRHGLDTPHEVASFISQVAHESNEFTHLEENLNYSAERLLQVWPRRFSSFAFAQRYEHSPTRLANYVYANRIGNGEEASGDGWRFHGRGPIQLTGRRNYTACAMDLGEPLLEHPELLLTPHVGIRSALWYWRTMNLDEVDDDEDVRIETRRINGGDIGLAHRKQYFDRCFKIMEAA